MIQIIKSNEPDCLKALRNNEENNYDNLQDECLTITRNLLSDDQKGLCAYCQRVLEPSIFIEHYIPQTVDDSKVLMYSNFLGVCSGKYYLNRKTGKHIEFCSCSRGNKYLSVNPELNSSISTIYYDDENKVRSSNSKIDIDLNDILNLNFEELCLDRNNAYTNLIKSIFELGQKFKLTKIDIYKKVLKSFDDRPVEFLGFLVFRLQKLIDYHSAK